MKRSSKIIIALAVALSLSLGALFGAAAADGGTLRQITAFLNSGITVLYNGAAQEMFDEAGNPVYPVSFDGTTYLPIRAVSNMLGISVDWNQESHTVILGDNERISGLIELGEDEVFRYNGLSYGITKDEMFDALGCTEEDMPLGFSGYQQECKLSGAEFMVFQVVVPKTDTYDHTMLMRDCGSAEETTELFDRIVLEFTEKFGAPTRVDRPTFNDGTPSNTHTVWWGNADIYTDADGKTVTYSYLSVKYTDNRLSVTIMPAPNPEK